MQKMNPTNWMIYQKYMLTAGSTIAYISIFILLYHSLGVGISALSVIPIIVIGWVFGIRGGFFAGLAMLILNTLLLNIFGESGWDVIMRLGGVPGAIVSVLIGVGVGRLSYLERQLEQRILEQEQITNELIKSEKTTKALLNAYPDAGLLLEPDGLIIALNVAASRGLGKNANDLIGTNVFDTLSPNITEIRKSKGEQVIQSRQSVQFEDTRDGRYFFHSLYPIVDQQDKVIQIAVFSRDITERKQIEESLQFQSKIAENISEGICLIRVNSGVIVYTNPKFEDMFGYRSNEMLGQHISIINASVNGQNPQDIAEEIFASLKEDGNWTGEVKNVKKDGTEIWCKVNGSSFEHSKYGTVWVSANTDITTHKWAEEALRKSEKHYRIVVELARDGIWLIDKDSYTSLVNPSMAQMLGYSIEEMQGKHLFTFMDEQGIEISKRNLERRRQGIKEQHDFELLHKDGTRIYVAMETAPMQDDAGNYIGAIASVMDLSHRKQAEDLLKSERNLLQTLIDNVPDFIFVKDHEGRFLISNIDHANAANLTPSDFIGKTAFDIYPEDLATQYHADDEQVLRYNKTLINQERAIRDYRDEPKWVLTSKVPLHNHDGEISGLVGITRDITESKRIEELLRQSEEKYRILIEDHPEFINRWDPSDGSHIFANASYRKHFNKTEDDIQNGTIFDSSPSELRESIKDKVLKSVQSLTPDNSMRHDENPGIAGDGELYWYSWQEQAIFDETGQIIEVQAIGRDITERKQAQETLQTALEKEKEIGLFRERFMEMASHEFRTPITVIGASSQMLRRYFEQLSPEKREKHINRIEKQVKHLDGMIDNIMLVLRTATDPLSYNPQKFDFEALCQNIVESLKSSIAEKHNLIFSYEEGLADLFADENLLNIIVSNLLSNAIKYSPKGTDIYLNITQKGDQRIIQIIDQGIGISPEDIEHLFEAYHRGNNVNNIKGIGLGMRIVKDFVEHHEGQIEVKSTIDKGTTFTVFLPTNLPII